MFVLQVNDDKKIRTNELVENQFVWQEENQREIQLTLSIFHYTHRYKPMIIYFFFIFIVVIAVVGGNVVGLFG